MTATIRTLLFMSAALFLVACGEAEQVAGPEERTIPVTAAEVRLDAVEVTEHAVGCIEAATSPMVAAEIPGRIVEILKDAGDTVAAGDLLARQDDSNARNAVNRLQALHEQAERTVTRMRNLVAQDSASQSLLDDAQAQFAALDAQLRDARTALSRTRITAPVSGTIQRRMVSVGDFRGVGDPLFQISAAERVRVVLPFPERLSARLAIGQAVRLDAPVGGGMVEAQITELRPVVGPANRAIEAIVELDNPGAWRAGASVSAELVLESRSARPMVPTLSVIQRPAGRVVYVIEGDRVRQQVIEIGVRTNGETEVVSGLRGGERVVLDGAGFLTDGARIAVRSAR